MLQLTTTQKATYTVEFFDSKNNPAPVDGAPVWAVSNPDAVSITPSADGKSCEVVAHRSAPEFQITCTADADLGSGVENIVLTDSIRVDPARAVSGRLVASAPVEQ